MNKKLNLIMNALMILLIFALIYVMMNYYAGTSSKTETNPTEIGTMLQQEKIISSGDKENIITNEILKNESSGDEKIDIEESEDVIQNQNAASSGDIAKDAPTVIMTSENEISSKEKKQILTELDKTLMELLDVVEKVQTVDETRLIVDDSEVQE